MNTNDLPVKEVTITNTPPTIFVDGETTTPFSDLTEHQQKVVIIVHAQGFKLRSRRTETLERIFRIGNPKIVFGVRESGVPYCRVDKDSEDIMKLLIKHYL